MAPFLADKTLIQQGYLGSEPFVIKQMSGIDPVVLLVADGGYNGYSNIITTSRKLIDEKPDLVQRFVDASIEGWYSFLYRRPDPGEQADQSGQSGNDRRAARLWTEDDEGPRHRRFRRRAQTRHRRDDRGAVEGVLPQSWSRSASIRPGIDVDQAYVTQFVDHRVGIEMKK